MQIVTGREPPVFGAGKKRTPDQRSCRELLTCICAKVSLIAKQTAASCLAVLQLRWRCA